MPTRSPASPAGPSGGAEPTRQASRPPVADARAGGASTSDRMRGLGDDLRMQVIAQLARKSLFSLREAAATDSLLAADIQDMMSPLDAPGGVGGPPLWKRAVGLVNRHLEDKLQTPWHGMWRQFAPLLRFLSPEHVDVLLPRADHRHDASSVRADDDFASVIAAMAPHLDAVSEASVLRLVDKAVAIESPHLRAQAILHLAQSPAPLGAAPWDRLVAASPVRPPMPAPEAADEAARPARSVFTATLVRHLDPVREVMQRVQRGEAMPRDALADRLVRVSQASSESDVAGLVDMLLALPDDDDEGAVSRDELLARFAMTVGDMAPTAVAHHAVDIDRAVAKALQAPGAVGQQRLMRFGNLAGRIPSLRIGDFLDAARSRPPMSRSADLQRLDVSIGHLTPQQVQAHQPEIERALDMWLETSAVEPPTYDVESCVNIMGRLDASRYDGIVDRLRAERAVRFGHLDSGGIGSLLANMHRLTDAQFGHLADIVTPPHGVPDLESLLRLPGALAQTSDTQFRERKDPILRMVAALETAAAAPGAALRVLRAYALSVAALVELRMSAIVRER